MLAVLADPVCSFGGSSSIFPSSIVTMLCSLVLSFSASRDNRDLTQQDGWKTQDGRMTKNVARDCAFPVLHNIFIRDSAVLSLPAVLLRKVPIMLSLGLLIPNMIFSLFRATDPKSGETFDSERKKGLALLLACFVRAN